MINFGRIFQLFDCICDCGDKVIYYLVNKLGERKSKAKQRCLFSKSKSMRKIKVKEKFGKWTNWNDDNRMNRDNNTELKWMN